MGFRARSIYMIAIALQMLQAPVSCQVSLMGNFDPQDYIIEGTVITLTCTVEDPAATSLRATIIEGSPAIFNCTSVNYIVSNRLYLSHSQMESATATCGELVSSRIVEVQSGIPSVYIAQINITTTISMNGGYVECREQKINDTQRILMPNIIGMNVNM